MGYPLGLTIDIVREGAERQRAAHPPYVTACSRLYLHLHLLEELRADVMGTLLCLQSQLGRSRLTSAERQRLIWVSVCTVAIEDIAWKYALLCQGELLHQLTRA